MRARKRQLAALVLAAMPAGVLACSSWSPSHPFERDAPPVTAAIGQLDAGDASNAAATLEDYLSTGPCKEGSIGLPDSVRRLPNGSFDLGLALFKVGETFGQRFGDEDVDAGPNGASDELHQRRSAQIACGLEVAQNVASDPNAPTELRAHARYLEGNLDFLGADYEAAVRAYDESIGFSPGMLDAGDPVGRDAAWNRAIALRRIEDQKDSGQDSGPQDGAPGDSGQPDGSSGDSGKPDGGSGGQDAAQPNEPDSGGAPDAGDDAAPPPPQPQDAATPQAPPPSQDERILDQLENAPTLQEEDAKRRAQTHRRVRGMEDK